MISTTIQSEPGQNNGTQKNIQPEGLTDGPEVADAVPMEGVVEASGAEQPAMEARIQCESEQLQEVEKVEESDVR